MSSDLHHPLVLVVDDDADTRELYTIMLESVGYRVECAATVRRATELMALHTPQVAITDWRLPDGDGFAVAEALRARFATRAVPIVAITGVTMSVDMERDAVARGFTSVLIKPASPDGILRAVRGANELATARQLRAAARRLVRYAAVSARHVGRPTDASSAGTLDARDLLERVVARSGEHITLMLADDSARYVAAGGSARELTGYELQELLSLSVWDLTPPSHSSMGQGLWNSFIAAGTQEGRYLLRRRDGDPVEAQYCAVANVLPGLHASVIAPATQIPGSL